MRRKKKRVYFEAKRDKEQLELYQRRNGKKFVQEPKIIPINEFLLIIEKLIPI